MQAQLSLSVIYKPPAGAEGGLGLQGDGTPVPGADDQIPGLS